MATVHQNPASAGVVIRLRMQKWAARSRSWIALLILAPFLAATLLSAPRNLEGSWGKFGFDSLAWFLFMVGAAIRWWSTLYIGGRKTTSLVIEGPYSICRNPLYVGTLFMGLTVATFLESLTFTSGLLLASFIYLATTVPVEEQRLLNRFNDEFVQYSNRVPRYLPNFRRFSSPETIEVSLQGLSAEGYRAARWIWLPFACSLIAHLRAQPFWPRFLRLP